MLNSAYSKAVAKSKASVAFVGLTSILAEAAGVILQLAEHEAYGIRGASIVLKLRLNLCIKYLFKSIILYLSTYSVTRIK